MGPVAKKIQVAGRWRESRQAGPDVSGVGPLPGLSLRPGWPPRALSLAVVLAAPAASAGATTTTGKNVKVSTAKVAGVGTVLTTASGLTLYRFTQDSPGTSTCTGACATIWPPLLAPKGAHVSGPHGVKGLSLLKVGQRPLAGRLPQASAVPLRGRQEEGAGARTERGWGVVRRVEERHPCRRGRRRPRRHIDHGARRRPDHAAGDADHTGPSLEREHGSERDDADTGTGTDADDPADDAGHLGTGGARAPTTTPTTPPPPPPPRRPAPVAEGMATSARGSRDSRSSLGTWAVVGATAALAAVGWRVLATAPGGPWHAMVTQGVVLIGPAVLALVGLAVAAERLWPAVARPVGAVGHRQDAAYLALYVALAVPAVTLIGAGAATVLQRLDGGFTVHPFAGLPRWALVTVVLVCIDLANWTSHLYNHRINAFWRFHALHHSQEEMSILTSFRAHPFVHTSFQLTAVPLIVLGTGGRPGLGARGLHRAQHHAARQRQLGLRPPALRHRQPRLPPAAPRPRRPTRGQPRHRAGAVGRPGRAGRVSVTSA